MISSKDLLPGDILIQCKGLFWCTATKLFTGHPYPHARIVSKNYNGFVLTLEETPLGVQETILKPDGQSYDISYYKVLRAPCSDEIKLNALEWIEHRLGESYAYSRFATIALGSALRLGYHQNYSDDDIALDDNPMICSELIARGYYRSGCDIVPHVESRDALPVDILLSPVLKKVL